MLSLCEAGRFGAAHLLLVGAGLRPDSHPGLWEALARQAARQRAPEAAHAARQAMWDAGARGADLALAEAQHFLDAGDHQSAGFIIRSVFGPIPDAPAARSILAHSYLADVRGAAEGGRPRTESAMALALAQSFEARSMADARVIADILYFAGEHEAALRQIEQALERFPGQVPLLLRQARLLDNAGRTEAAIEILEEVAASYGEHRSEALFRLLNARARLGHRREMADVAARLSLEPLTLTERCRLALEMGRPEVVTVLVSELARDAAGGGGAGISAEESRQLGDLLLDHGLVGLLVWLRRKRVALSDRVKDALDGAGFGVNGSRTPPRNFEAAQAILSPDFMVPVERFLDRPPKPAGWPGRARAPERLLLVSPSLAMGGAERQLVTLVRALIASGRMRPEQIDVACFSLAADRGRAAFRPELERLGVALHDLSHRLPLRRPLSAAAARLTATLPQVLRQDTIALHELALDLRPDTLHAWQDKSVLAGGLVAHLLSVPHVVLSLRNMSPDTRREARLARQRALYADFAATPRFRITANTRAAAQDYGRWLGCAPGRVELLTNAVDLSELPALAQARPRREADAPLSIGGVFRLAANKRPGLWLRTLAALSGQLQRPLRPLLFGSGPLLGEIRAEARALGLAGLEIVTGETDQARIYPRLDALLLMSRVEGLPNVLLEAQAWGLPVAACAVGGVADAVLAEGPGRGLLLPADTSPEAAATALAGWLPEALSAPPETARAFIERQFSPAALVERAMAQYTGQEAGQ